jgi:hypothetical protein
MKLCRSVLAVVAVVGLTALAGCQKKPGDGSDPQDTPSDEPGSRGAQDDPSATPPGRANPGDRWARRHRGRGHRRHWDRRQPRDGQPRDGQDDRGNRGAQGNE